MSALLNKELRDSKSNTLNYQRRFDPSSWERPSARNYEKQFHVEEVVSKISNLSFYSLELGHSKIAYRPYIAVFKNINSDFQYILDSLENAKTIPFDEEETVVTKPVSELVWDLVKDFLILNSEWINTHYGILIDVPDISSLPNGSVDILWYNKKGKVLVNIDNSLEKKAYFYSDFHNKKNPMKGNVNIDAEIDESLAIRIKKLNEND